MSSTQHKKPSTNRSGSGRTKLKLAKAASKTKALVHQAEHVRKQTIKANSRVRAPTKASGADKKTRMSGAGDVRATDNAEVRSTEAMTENSRPAIAVPTQIFAFWSPMAMLLRQQTLLTSMVLNVMQSHRNLAQAFIRSA
jgi:hypothetical protein